MIYLDYAATTPMSDEALKVYGEVARKYFGNTSSIHDYGSSAKNITQNARRSIAAGLNAEPRGIFFTGGGSEANQLAIQSLAKGNQHNGRHIITTKAEHSSVRYIMNVLSDEGFKISYAVLDEYGSIDLEKLEKLITDDTILVSIHHGNSEIGTLQNIEAIGKLLKKYGILFHSDCVQTFGKVPVDVHAAGLDSITISAHKIYGPKGVGAAYIAPSVNWKPIIPGTTQEHGFRAGTVDVPGIASFMAAVRSILKTMRKEYEKENKLRERLIAGLKELPFDLIQEGNPECHLPNIIGLRISGMEGQYAMLECNRYGLAISTGSACSVGTEKAAASMKALGRTEQHGREFIRLSLGKNTTEKEIDESIAIFKKVLTHHFNMIKL